MGAGYTHVYFDLDGTLIDHFDAIHRSFAHAGEQLGFTRPSYEKVVASVGGSVPVTASRLFPEGDPALVAELFEQHFEKVMFDNVEINSGVEWLLESLHNKGIKSIVFTNKRSDRARSICEHLGLHRWLCGIIGTGDTPHRKPEKEFSEYALNQHQADAKNSCLIGDSPFDEQAATVVGMDCFLVATGSHAAECLRAETQSPLFQNMVELGSSVFGFQT